MKLVEEAPFVHGKEALAAGTSRPLPADAPLYCPLCGRLLEVSGWNTTDGAYRYWALMCFGGNPLRPLLRRFKMTYPSGTHYEYHFGPLPNTLPHRYDTRTGEPLEIKEDNHVAARH